MCWPAWTDGQTWHTTCLTGVSGASNILVIFKHTLNFRISWSNDVRKGARSCGRESVCMSNADVKTETNNI